MERTPGPSVESFEELAFQALLLCPGETLSARQMADVAQKYNFRIQISTRHVAFSDDFINQLDHSMRRSSNPSFCFANNDGKCAPFRSQNDREALTMGPWEIWFHQEAEGFDYGTYKSHFFDAIQRKGHSRGVRLYSRMIAGVNGYEMPPERKRLVQADPIACIDFAMGELQVENLGQGSQVSKVYVYPSCIEFVNAEDETHRIGGPAVISRESLIYANRGQFHRTDGPAVIGTTCEYYIQDEEIDCDDEAAKAKAYIGAVIRNATKVKGSNLSLEERTALQQSALRPDSLTAYARDQELLDFFLDYVNRLEIDRRAE